MTFHPLFNRFRKAPTPLVTAPVAKGFGTDEALYVAGLIANLINRAADTGGFRGAIGAHPYMTATTASLGSDEGERVDIGLTAIATAPRARITLTGADAIRLGFLGFAPVHKQAKGFEPEWSFDAPEAAMAARVSIIGVTLDVECTDNPDGSATIALNLAV